jgi:hypothetical protein
MSIGRYYGRTRGCITHWSGKRLMSCTVGTVDRHPPAGAAWTLKFTPTGEGNKRLANRLHELAIDRHRAILDAQAYLDAVDRAVEKAER